MATSGEDKMSILRSRAGALARAIDRPIAAESTTAVVSFRLSGTQYAVPSAYVREVLMHRVVTPVPCTPAFVLGIMNLRGQILPVIELKSLLQLPPAAGAQDLGRVIVVGAGGTEVGIQVDAIFGVRLIPIDSIQPPLPELPGAQASLVRGVTSEPVIILDAEKILSDTALPAERRNGAPAPGERGGTH